ncbi:ribosomal protein L3 N(5)-glutamine methyltransferase [Hydrogenophaga crassostreae]|uniref:Ribosomal protein L3 N(5)-glutamine methyltransferase n=1 Tax=Hydrogenophaga crassostreae TaxID=1763535 RepID=A0A167HXR1_9BURK|nr:50S ribosomal protein L3 N(5)-glutamine methyltransferase [Hydrogenophaga crassostreae]AOW13581.1 ribosomal protein L3 N(5)-glutamine methyltransferase [Hydrogenophaga crassostreae]OAD41875.1 ribosomal protein L3 N(5)-glutamine methyltransferase [Hydrogenophaga crassostreae]
MTLQELLAQATKRLAAAPLAYGHGTTNAHDEAAWLMLWQLGMPLDSDLDALASQAVTPEQTSAVDALINRRIETRQPAAYLTNEAWLQGVPFYIDERSIVPRSFIAELIADGDFDEWLSDTTHQVLDLCTGNGSLAVLTAMAWPDVLVTGADLSPDALAVARINVDKHKLQDRITLIESDGLNNCPGPYDLIVCNPPYVNATSMGALPAEYLAEPEMALAGGSDGMDFIRNLLRDAPSRMSPDGVLVLEIGNERPFFEAAFPQLEAVWLTTSAGDDQVLLLTAESLLVQSAPDAPAK